MQWLILIPIYFYWHAVPPFLKKRSCLFKESCSHFIFRIAKDKGFIAGWKAFMWRYHNCRKGYRITSNTAGKFEMHLVTGNVVPESEIADVILKPFLDAMSSVLKPAERTKDLSSS